jgi:uncharacterized protein with PIN domain
MSAPDEPKFMMDQMLVVVGKYLRIIGCDADWDFAEPRHGLILRANDVGRIFVTCNHRQLDENPKPDKTMLLKVGDPVDQFYEIVRLHNLDLTSRLFTKCIRCNLPLETVADKELIRGKVHPNVFVRHEHFYTCPRCATLFWRGSHVANTCLKLGLPPPPETIA